MHLSRARASVTAISIVALAGAALAGPAAAQDEMSGEGKSLAIITPWYAAQPVVRVKQYKKKSMDDGAKRSKFTIKVCLVSISG